MFKNLIKSYKSSRFYKVIQPFTNEESHALCLEDFHRNPDKYMYAKKKKNEQVER